MLSYVIRDWMTIELKQTAYKIKEITLFQIILKIKVMGKREKWEKICQLSKIL